MNHSDTQNPPTSSPSPVTWHVLLWVLVSLAINSMAQPAGRVCGISFQCKVYLRSSPIICATDAFSMLVTLIITSIYLRISPRKAANLLLLARHDDCNDDDGAEEIAETCRPEIQEVRHSTWFRWLFFILGPLPATIKLGSFTRVPWTQAWGMMFLTSFVIFDLILLLSTSSIRPKDHASIPEALGYTITEWNTPEHYTLRRKMKVLRIYNLRSQVMALALMFIAHMLLVGWMAIMLLTGFFFSINESQLARDISTVIRFVTYSVIMIVIMISFIRWIFRMWTSPDRQMQVKPTLLVIYKIYLVGTLLPNAHTQFSYPMRTASSWTKAGLTLIIIIYAWHHIYFLILSPLKWFLGTIKTKVSNTPSPSSNNMPLQEIATPSQQGEIVPVVNNPINEITWWGIGFFLCNLTVCVLWYAFKYNPTGTINPAWTDVFG